MNLCIDFGSTFIKFLIINKSKVVFKDKIDFPDPCIENGNIYEVDIKKLDNIVLEIFEKTKGFLVEKCFIAVQMHGCVIKDKNGIFSNYVSWKDKRGDITNLKLRKIDFEKNGTSLKNNLPVVKLIEQNLDGSEFFTLGSYIAQFLTGKNLTHKTDACASGFFDAASLNPIDVCKNLILPTVANEVVMIGTYNNIEIYTPVGDHQLSFLGSGAEDRAYLLNIGTATQISTLCNGWVDSNGFEKRPYFTAKRLLTVTGLTGGEQLFNGYSVNHFCEEILQAAKKLPPQNKMLVGGGGAEIVFEQLKTYLEKNNIDCERIEKNISEEGFKKIMECKETKIGTMLSEVCFPNFPVILKNENVDFLIIDNEHGAFDYNFLSAVVMNSRLVGLPLIIRLPDNNRKDITKLVDMGVSGFLLPMTNTAKDIEKVVDFAKYAPIGKRGISTNRAHTFYNPPPIDEYMVTANKQVKVYAQIETKEGVNNIYDILSVNGVDGVFVGPNDLSCDMNCIGDNGPIKEVLKTVSMATKSCDKVWGIITTSRDLINCSLEIGVDYISYGSEINMLKDSCKAIKGRIF